jgi:hypothetical protein
MRGDLGVRAAAALCAATWAVGQAEAQGAGSVLEPLRFQEAFNNIVALPGGVLFGVAIGDIEPLADASRIAIDFRGGTASRLCVSVLSIDGRYWAKLEFDISNLPSGTYRVRFPTSYAAELGRFRRYEVAVNPELSDQCRDGPIKGYGAVRWTQAASDAQVTLLVNSSDVRTTLEVPHRYGGSVRYDCKALSTRITGPYHYNSICTAEISSDLNLQQAQLMRYRVAGSPPSLIPVPIVLP